jgi:hypothetical protein
MHSGGSLPIFQRKLEVACSFEIYVNFYEHNTMTSHKTVIFIAPAVRTSDPTGLLFFS